MRAEDIAKIRDTYRRPGYGTMSVEDLVSIDGLIAAHSPQSFLEIGTASGLSAGVIAHMLEEYGGQRLTTVDLLPHFYADKTKEAGFVIPLAYPHGPVAVERRVKETSIDIAVSGDTFDMALVDGGHAHPWPMIDTLCVNAVLTGPRIVVQDDLTLFRRRPDGRGVGPKILFDQFPQSHRQVFDEGGGNLFAVSLDLPRDQLEEMALDAFAMPWTLRSAIPDDLLRRFQRVLDVHYSEAFSQEFARLCDTFNQPNGQFFRNPRRVG